MIIIDDFAQESPEWFAERLGNPGSASFDQILTNVQREPSKSLQSLMMQLAGEYVAGVQEDTYKGNWMIKGNEREPEARIKFMEHTGLLVQEIALCYPDEHKKYHASTDGIVEDGAPLEIKCPKLKTHLEYLFSGEFPVAKYNAQVQGEILVTGADHAWFMSYYPNLVPFITKVPADPEYIKKLETALDKFCVDLAVMIGRVKIGF